MSERARTFEQFVNEYDDFMTSPDAIRLIVEEGMGPVVQSVENRDIVCSELIPMQVHIDPEKSIKHCLTNPNVTRNLFAHDPIMIKKPIIVYNNKYIMDGHHAWAEAVIFRPDSEISCINLNGAIDPREMLEKVRAALVMIMTDDSQGRDVKSKYDLFTMSEPVFKHYVLSNLSEASEEVFAEHGIRDVVEHAIDGVERMQHNNNPIYGAKQRTEMPQFGSGTVRRDALDTLRGTSIDEEHSPENFRPNIDPELGFSEEFMERIATALELVHNGLLPANTFSVFDPPESPRKIFVYYKAGTWVAAVLNDESRTIMRQEKGKEFQRLMTVNEADKYEIIPVDHRMKLPNQFLKRISGLYSLVQFGLMDKPRKAIELRLPDQRFRFYCSEKGWILTNSHITGTILKINASDGFFKQYVHNTRFSAYNDLQDKLQMIDGTSRIRESSQTNK